MASASAYSAHRPARVGSSQDPQQQHHQRNQQPTTHSAYNDRDYSDQVEMTGYAGPGAGVGYPTQVGELKGKGRAHQQSTRQHHGFGADQHDFLYHNQQQAPVQFSPIRQHAFQASISTTQTKTSHSTTPSYYFNSDSPTLPHFLVDAHSSRSQRTPSNSSRPFAPVTASIPSSSCSPNPPIQSTAAQNAYPKISQEEVESLAGNRTTMASSGYGGNRDTLMTNDGISGDGVRGSTMSAMTIDSNVDPFQYSHYESLPSPISQQPPPPPIAQFGTTPVVRIGPPSPTTIDGAFPDVRNPQYWEQEEEDEPMDPALAATSAYPTPDSSPQPHSNGQFNSSTSSPTSSQGRVKSQTMSKNFSRPFMNRGGPIPPTPESPLEAQSQTQFQRSDSNASATSTHESSTGEHNSSWGDHSSQGNHSMSTSWEGRLDAEKQRMRAFEDEATSSRIEMLDTPRYNHSTTTAPYLSPTSSPQSYHPSPLLSSSPQFNERYTPSSASAFPSPSPTTAPFDPYSSAPASTSISGSHSAPPLHSSTFAASPLYSSHPAPQSAQLHPQEFTSAREVQPDDGLGRSKDGHRVLRKKQSRGDISHHQHDRELGGGDRNSGWSIFSGKSSRSRKSKDPMAGAEVDEPASSSFLGPMDLPSPTPQYATSHSLSPSPAPSAISTPSTSSSVSKRFPPSSAPSTSNEYRPTLQPSVARSVADSYVHSPTSGGGDYDYPSNSSLGHPAWPPSPNPSTGSGSGRGDGDEMEMLGDQMRSTRMEKQSSNPSSRSGPVGPQGSRPISQHSLYSQYSYYPAEAIGASKTSPTSASPSPYSSPNPNSYPDSDPIPPMVKFDAGTKGPSGGTISKATAGFKKPTLPKSANGGEDEMPANPTTPDDFLQLGIIYHEKGELERSAHCFEKSATLNGGCGAGALMYGLTLRHGWGCHTNTQLGFKYLQAAAESVVHDLDTLVSGGIGGMSQSEHKARAAKSELVLALHELGNSFRFGWGVEKNKKMAVRYFQLAADLGDQDAQCDLAFCYANGKGCKKDMKKAAKYYRMAVAQGVDTFGLSWIHKSKYDD